MFVDMTGEALGQLAGPSLDGRRVGGGTSLHEVGCEAARPESALRGEGCTIGDSEGAGELGERE